MKRIVKKPIQLYRNGAFISPTVGSVIDLTEAELTSIRSSNPTALGHLVEADPAPVVKALEVEVVKSGKVQGKPTVG